MSPNRVAPPDDASPELTAPAEQVRERLAAQVAKGRELLTRLPTMNEADIHQEKERWNSFNKDLLRRSFTNANFVNEYEWNVATGSNRASYASDRRTKYHAQVEAGVNALESIQERLEIMASPSLAPAPPSAREHTNRAFLVHGHDEALRESVARFMERLGVDVVILHEQSGAALTLIEKLERHSDVDFAVVLLTADDEGRKKGAPALQPRARQNVILELGYFAGRLGRERVAVVYEKGVELPSDVGGVAYVSADTDLWKLSLAKELRNAGFAVDLNKV